MSNAQSVTVPQIVSKHESLRIPPVVTNLLFGTTPGLVHANGPFINNLYWDQIKRAAFGCAKAEPSSSRRMVLITCNNGHSSMGLLERSAEQLGVEYLVGGRNSKNWVNAIHKPAAILDVLDRVTSDYVLYADSRDALILESPDILLDRFLNEFRVRMLFSADRVNFPPNRRLRMYEESLPGAMSSPFRYLNSGIWIGETAFVKQFYGEVKVAMPLPEGPFSDQGLIRQLLPAHPESIGLDYRCSLFQNVGFVAQEILEISECKPSVDRP